jgi:hypothetical protein
LLIINKLGKGIDKYNLLPCNIYN